MGFGCKEDSLLCIYMFVVLYFFSWLELNSARLCSFHVLKFVFSFSVPFLIRFFGSIMILANPISIECYSLTVLLWISIYSRWWRLIQKSKSGELFLRLVSDNVSVCVCELYFFFFFWRLCLFSVFISLVLIICWSTNRWCLT